MPIETYNKPGAQMTSEQQALAEMPIWLVIVLALVGGVSGDMWRADKEGARGWATEQSSEA